MTAAERLVARSEVHKHPGYDWANPRWLVRQNREKRLGFYRAGGRILISLTELDRYVASGRVDPVRHLPERRRRTS